MYRIGPRRRTSSARIARRTARFVLESLELRRLLSTAVLGTTVTPAVQLIPSNATLNPAVTNTRPLSGSFEPGQISVAYAFYVRPENGSGTTIAIVDSFHDPNIRADLAVFDAYYHLPSANLTIMNQYGDTANLPPADPGWALEIASDVEWAHAIAPSAKILLVEAKSANTNDLVIAIQTAARLANVVSMSWGGGEFPGEAQYDGAAYFGNPNVAFVAATGDDGGASGAEWPAVSPNVIGVGGSSLYMNSGGYASESAWNGTRSRSGPDGSAGGVSLLEPMPYFQSSVLGPIATGRLTPDVAAVGNPNTGLAVYNSVPGGGSTGWLKVGGTSVGAPIWAGLIARADQARGANQRGPLSSAQLLNLLYGSYTTRYGSFFHDITVGSNFAGTAKPGYDLVTGLGTPIANNIIAAAATFDGSAPAPAVAPAPRRRIRHPIPRRHRHDVEFVEPVAEMPTQVIAAGPGITATLGPLSGNTSVSPAAPFQPLNASPAAKHISGTLLSRPVQPLTERRTDLQTDEDAQISTAAAGSREPDLYLAPDIELDLKFETPQSSASRMHTRRLWDDALYGYAAEETVPAPRDFVPPMIDPENSGVETSSAAAMSVALIFWTAWEYQSRQSEKDQRRSVSPVGPLVEWSV